MRRSFSTTSAGTSSRVRYCARSDAICIATPRAVSTSSPSNSTRTPIAGGRSLARRCMYDATLPSNTATRPSSSFSPMVAASASMFSATVLPSASVSVSSASRSPCFDAAACATMSLASCRNSSFFATKSVSQLSSTMAPSAAVTSPALAVRSAPRFWTFAAYFTRKISVALSKSPSASSSARLASIIPAPVESRSFFTSAAATAISFFSRRRTSSYGSGPDRQDGPSGLGRSVTLGRRLSSRGGRFRGRSGFGSGCGVSGRSRLRSRRCRVAATLQQVALPVGERLIGSEARGLRLLIARRRTGTGQQALGDGVRDDAGERGDRPDGVVVARDRVVDLIRVTVGVEDRDDRDAELACLRDRDVLLLRVNHPDGARQLLHVADAAEGARELLPLAGEDQRLLLGKHVRATGLLEDLELLQPLQALVDRLEVGKKAAEPALVDIG